MNEVGMALDLVTNTRIKVPKVPNFLLVASEGGDRSISIADLSENNLRVVAEHWVKSLIKRRLEIVFLREGESK